LNLPQDSLTTDISRTCPTDLADLRLLVVDDLEVNRRVLHEQLKNWRLEHKCVPSGADALTELRAAQSSGRPYAIALLDYLMPQMDGETLARLIKADSTIADTALIMLTSGSQREDARRFLANGFAAYLLKPVVRPVMLLEAIRRAVALKAPAASRSTPSPSVATQPASNIITPMPTPALPGYRVLVAEDNQTNQRIVTRFLQKLNCRVDVVGNGREALEMYERLPYDCIFMDCQMPEMDGYEATQRIREQQQNGHRIPIIALTAGALPGDREKCLAAGMDEHLTKPLKLEDLKRALEVWVAPSAGESAQELVASR
jgi:CheY-like chemotaxis protein